jgi:hypothetical protein
LHAGLRETSKTVPGPDADDLRAALDTVLTHATSVHPEVGQIARTWSEHAERLTAASYGLFASGTQPDDLLDDLETGLWQHNPGSLARLDYRELLASPLPSGSVVLWTGYDNGEEAPTPGRVDLHIARSLDEAQDRAARRGASLTIMQHPDAVDRWIQETRHRLGDRAPAVIAGAFALSADTERALDAWRQEGVALLNRTRAAHLPVQHDVQRALDAVPGGRPDRVQDSLRRVLAASRTGPAWLNTAAPHWQGATEALMAQPHLFAEGSQPTVHLAARPAPDAPEPAPIAWRVAPWGAGQAVLWTDDPKRRWGRLEGDQLVPVANDAPCLVTSSRGFHATLQELQARWPSVTAEELPPSLSRKLAASAVGAPPAPSPQDCLWQVSEIPGGGAVAWTYVSEPFERPDGSIGVSRRPAALSRTNENAPVRWDTVAEARTALEQQELATVPAGRVLPRVVADQVFPQVEEPDRPGVRPPEPFEALAALDPERQRDVLVALPDTLRGAAQAAAHGLQPREVAYFRNEPIGQVTSRYRAAERAVGDWFAQHPGWNDPLDVDEPDPTPPMAPPQPPVPFPHP